MSESHRDQNQLSNTFSTQNHRNSKDQSERYNRKRSHLDIEDIDAKVFIGNIPTEKLTDEELLDFVKPFGKVSDIRVFKDHIFVQYNRIDDANKLINEGKTSLILKGHKLNILSARDVRSTSTNSSSTDRSSKRSSHENNSHRSSSSSYDSSGKRFSIREKSNFDRKESNSNERISRSDSRRSSNETLPRYTILSGPKNSNDLIDCQIIIVNIRQREYAEEIESRLRLHGLIISIILLREDYTLVEAIENAARLNCLYGIIVMPMHEERRTASFHILYGQTEEHRNLTLEDGIHIILTNFLAYKERLQNDKINPYRPNHESIIYSQTISSSDYSSLHDNINPPILTLGDKLPLSMLLCLLADGRQLTLEEIDRILVYLLEKKAKMLTLPPGTLPPLPAQYAIAINSFNHHTDSRSVSTTDVLSGNSLSTSTDVPLNIAEQIRQFISMNIIKSNSSTTDTLPTPLSSQSPLDKLSDIVKIENGNIAQVKPIVKDTTNEYVQQQTQSYFTFPKAEAVPTIIPSFNYPSSTSTTGSVNSFPTTNFSSFNSVNPSMTIDSTTNSTTSVPVPNFISQSSQYFFPISTSNVYSSNKDATAAILQAYSQFNVQPTATSNMIHQQLTTTQQQQQQIRK